MHQDPNLDGGVYGIRLRSLTVYRLILKNKLVILILKRFQRSSRDGNKPRDKQPRSQHPLALVPGEKTTKGIKQYVLDTPSAWQTPLITLTAFEKQKIYFYLFIFHPSIAFAKIPLNSENKPLQI